MTPDQEKRKWLEDMLKMLSGTVTRTEFLNSFKEVIALVTKIESQLIQKINTEITSKVSSGVSSLQEMKNEMEQVISDVRKSNDSTFAGIKKRAMESMTAMFVKMDIQGQMDSMMSGMKSEHEEMMSAMSDTEKKMEQKMSEMKSVNIPPPETAEQTRDLLETLKGDERLEIKAIKDLQEKLDALEKKIGTGGGNAVYASQRGAVKLYDLSAQLNGVLKTFSLPAFWRVINVTSSSFPNAFRPTVDYTTDGGASTITFTSEISASSTLAAGQTLLVEYAEA